MRIFALTSRGERLAQSPNTPNTAAWKVVHFLHRNKQASDDRISEYTGLSPVETAVAIRTLKGKGIVSEMGESEAMIA